MTRKEYDRMCVELEVQTNQLLRAVKDEQRKHRSQCLRLMQKLGIDTTDWVRVNAFCEDPRIAGKVFRRLSNEELDQLAVKLRTIERKGGLRPPTPSASMEKPKVDYLLMSFGKGGEA